MQILETVCSSMNLADIQHAWSYMFAIQLHERRNSSVKFGMVQARSHSKWPSRGFTHMRHQTQMCTRGEGAAKHSQTGKAESLHGKGRDSKSMPLGSLLAA